MWLDDFLFVIVKKGFKIAYKQNDDKVSENWYEGNVYFLWFHAQVVEMCAILIIIWIIKKNLLFYTKAPAPLKRYIMSKLYILNVEAGALLYEI